MNVMQRVLQLGYAVTLLLRAGVDAHVPKQRHVQHLRIGDVVFSLDTSKSKSRSTTMLSQPPTKSPSMHPSWSHASYAPSMITSHPSFTPTGSPTEETSSRLSPAPSIAPSCNTTSKGARVAHGKRSKEKRVTLETSISEQSDSEDSCKEEGSSDDGEKSKDPCNSAFIKFEVQDFEWSIGDCIPIEKQSGDPSVDCTACATRVNERAIKSYNISCTNLEGKGVTSIFNKDGNGYCQYAFSACGTEATVDFAQNVTFHSYQALSHLYICYEQCSPEIALPTTITDLSKKNQGVCFDDPAVGVRISTSTDPDLDAGSQDIPDDAVRLERGAVHDSRSLGRKVMIGVVFFYVFIASMF